MTLSRRLITARLVTEEHKRVAGNPCHQQKVSKLTDDFIDTLH